MDAFVGSEPHLHTMSRIDDWCDEATFVEWEQAAACLDGEMRPSPEAYATRADSARALWELAEDGCRPEAWQQCWQEPGPRPRRSQFWLIGG
jgi:hypothetical protein